MSTRNARLSWTAAALCFLVFLVSICSLSQAGTIYWGFPGIYSSWGPGNFIAGSLSNMTARAFGAYAFADYASAWGLNNCATGGLLGAGAMTPWMQMYSLAPMFGYSSALFNNPWPNSSIFLSSYSPLTSSLFSSPYSYSYPATYTYPTLDFAQWPSLSLPQLTTSLSNITTTATPVATTVAAP